MARPQERRESGYVLVWLIVVFTWAAASIFIAIEALDPNGPMPLDVYARPLAVMGVMIALGLALEARDDPLEASQMACALFAALALEYAYFALASGEPVTRYSIGFGLALGACALSGWSWYGLAHRRELFPDFLLEHFDEQHVAEVDGVQFVVHATENEVLAGDAYMLVVHAQNAYDQPRTLRVDLEHHHRLLGRQDLAFPKDAAIVLPPVAAGLLEIPIATHSNAKGSYEIRIVPRVEGSGGRRARVFRGRHFQYRQNALLHGFFLVLTGLLTLLGTFGVLLGGRGGTRLKFQVVSNPHGSPHAPLTAARPESWLVYEPEPHELLALELDDVEISSQ